jgi:hypothetical protein
LTLAVFKKDLRLAARLGWLSIAVLLQAGLCVLVIVAFLLSQPLPTQGAFDVGASVLQTLLLLQLLCLLVFAALFPTLLLRSDLTGEASEVLRQGGFRFRHLLSAAFLAACVAGGILLLVALPFVIVAGFLAKVSALDLAAFYVLEIAAFLLASALAVSISGLKLTPLATYAISLTVSLALALILLPTTLAASTLPARLTSNASAPSTGWLTVTVAALFVTLIVLFFAPSWLTARSRALRPGDAS